MKRITAELHLKLSFNPLNFAKPGEAQDKAAKRYLAALKRKVSAPGTRIFPKIVPKSTAHYVEMYERANSALCLSSVYENLSTNPVEYVDQENVEIFTDE